MSPSALPPPVPSSARARSLGAGRGARELAPRAGRRRQPSGPTSWRRRARRSRGTRSPPSAESLFPAPTQRAQAGRRRRETDPGSGCPSEVPRGGTVGAEAPGRQISKRTVHAGLGELQDLVGVGLPRPDPLPRKAGLDRALQPQTGLSEENG